jgi:arsenite methyltransferase
MEDVSEQDVRTGVRDAYSEAAEHPSAEHPFPVGRRFAESVGYPPELLHELPAESSDAYAGVSNISITAAIMEGSRVLDLGCGAGLDSLIAAKRVGPNGEVVGVDFSPSMLTRAQNAASRSVFADRVLFLHGAAESIPVASQWADVALVNGIFNLNPAREKIFHELARVVKPGGAVFCAELILCGPLPPDVKADPENWFA